MVVKSLKLVELRRAGKICEEEEEVERGWGTEGRREEDRDRPRRDKPIALARGCVLFILFGLLAFFLFFTLLPPFCSLPRLLLPLRNA